jgi:glutathione peroxidase
MKTSIIMATLCILMASLSFGQSSASANSPSFHQFKVTDLNGEEMEFSQLKGKKVMIVNTASKCGYTPQYKKLEELYQTYKDQNFVILGFPCNDFGGQEPGSDREIANFCEKNYGVTFKMMSKISVKGKDMHPVYQWLTKKKLNGVADAEVSWNFTKFLIDENGNWVKTLGSRVSPDSEEIINWITGK